jgi:hypothetical protein
VTEWPLNGHLNAIYFLLKPYRIPAPQMTTKIKTSIGVEMNRESIYILDIVSDEDGSLKIKRMEEFTDSKAYLDFYQAVVAAKKQ